MKPFNIVSADYVLVDVMGDSEDPKIKALIDQFKLKRGGKTPIKSEEDLKLFLEAFDIDDKEKIPGGSSANTLVTMSHMMKGKVKVRLFSVAGKGNGEEKDADTRIRQSLREANVDLLPGQLPDQPPAESALSFVVEYPDGARSIATWEGNARKLLKSPMLTDEHVGDAYFVQLGLKQKLDDTREKENGHAEGNDLGFVDKMLQQRWDNGKDLWMAMPTQADFKSEGKSHAFKVLQFQELIKSANVVFGNDEELSRVLTTPEESMEIEHILRDRNIRKEHLETPEKIKALVDDGFLTPKEARKFDFNNKILSTAAALERLQEKLKLKLLEKKKEEGEWKGNTRQVAFITLGDKGAAIVTADNEIQYIPALKVNEEERKGTTLGCGDTSYAGFLSSYVAQELHRPDLDLKGEGLLKAYVKAGETGVALASAKLKEVKGPRLPDPLHSLSELKPDLAVQLTQDMARMEKSWAKEITSRGGTAAGILL